MSIEPPEPLETGPPPRERPIILQVAASVALHGAVLLLLLAPMLRSSLDAPPPEAIEVELVPPSSEPSSAEPSSAEPSSEGPSQEPSSMAPASSQDGAPDVSSAEAASEPPASEPPPEAASSAEELPSGSPAPERAQPVAPVPMARPVVIALGATDDVATDTSSAEPDGAMELTAETDGAGAGDASRGRGDTDGPAVQLGELHVAEQFYLAQILDTAAMAKAREALEGLPHDKRLSQTCNIEAIGQVANAGQGFSPDAVIVDAFSKSAISGTRLVATGAIFRSAQKWYALAFDCTLNDELTEVTGFTFRLGPDVTTVVTKKP